jgi:hypothetical protein
MLFRRLLPLLAILGLVLAGPHAAAMAMPMAAPMEMAGVSDGAEASPCHQEKAADQPAKAPEKASCCPDGCKGQCAPVLAFPSSSAEPVSGVTPAAAYADLGAPEPDGAPLRQERPPRSIG